jgi:hypothetical protein
VNVAGYCAGVNNYAGLSQAVIITKSLTIQGGYTMANWDTPDAVANPTTLDAVGLGRVVYIGGPVDVTIDGMRLTGGETNGLGYDAPGGGIWNEGQLTLSRSVVFSNSVRAAQRDAFGGGIWNQGVLTVTQSTVAHNRAVGLAPPEEGAGEARGGGIASNAGQVVVISSTIANNLAQGAESGAGNAYGGGLHVTGGTSGMILTLANSTLSGYKALHSGEANGQGGALFLEGTAFITNSTIASNTASTAGGNIQMQVQSGFLYLKNSLMAYGSAATDPNCSPASSPGFVSNGHNLGDDDSCNLTDTNNDIIDIDPLLGPLQDNGGLNQTHALLPGSPAIDAADNATCAADPSTMLTSVGWPARKAVNATSARMKAVLRWLSASRRSRLPRKRVNGLPTPWSSPTAAIKQPPTLPSAIPCPPVSPMCRAA